MPLSFTTTQVDAMFAAAAPVAREHRRDFVQCVVDQFPNRVEVGDGELHRAICEAQRKFFDPPNLSHASGPALLRTDKMKKAASA